MEVARPRLVLETGETLEGRFFGDHREAFGEVVFNTSMCGYQEVLTDPSYRGQILTMTYPLVGNYGVREGQGGRAPETPSPWFESQRIQVRGFVVREATAGENANDDSSGLDAFLRSFGIPGIDSVDSRAVVLKVREHGVLRGFITTRDPSEAARDARARPFPDRENLVAEVSVSEPVEFPPPAGAPGAPRVALIDCGVKISIVRNLGQWARVTVLPWDTTEEAVRRLKPDALVVSNGPGDPSHPEVIAKTVPTVRALAPELPTLGICLGHQILALAFGARTYKLKFGHRGSNHPVYNEVEGKVRITSQNHGFSVEELPSELVADEVSLNDRSIEGFRHETLPIIARQYHPEAAPGPHDSRDQFAKFQEIVRRAGRGGGG
jgi:carbamoyl-phosphate synthase small subunit